jgi:hypothetical protein
MALREAALLIGHLLLVCHVSQVMVRADERQEGGPCLRITTCSIIHAESWTFICNMRSLKKTPNA